MPLAVHVFVELEFKDPKDQDGVGSGWFSEVGLSENSVPLHPIVLLIIIPTKWLFHWGYGPHFQTYPSWFLMDVEGFQDVQDA